MKLRITRKLIDKAEALRELQLGPRAKKCPVALAMAEAGRENIHVGPFEASDSIHAYAYGAGVEQFIKDFDAELPVEPCDAELIAVRTWTNEEALRAFNSL